ncbi:peptidase M4 family protein [Streptomyces griseocarneus]|nr:peptidase M4 family protein [Streptomyces griseocarneus]
MQRGEPLRKPKERTRASRSTSGIAGIAGSAAALVSVAALVVSAVPADAASVPRGEGPGQVIPGQRTETPSLVEGIHEQVTGGGSAADAARHYLADKKSRYHIAAPARDLKAIRTTASGSTETVRLQQKHRGVDVFGGQYVVRMEKKGGKRVVTGTSGKYFTALTADTTPGVDEALAIERAVDATYADLVAKKPAKDAGDDQVPLTGEARGLVVLPKGAGVLTQHVTVRGKDPATGEPVLREVYVEANGGYPVLQYSGIRTFAGPGRTPGGEAAAQRQARRALVDGIQGSGVKFDGKTVELNLTKDDANKQYVMRDRTRSQEGSDKNQLSTWDARGLSVGDVSGTWPSNIKEFASPGPNFGQDATDAGAVDAHWAAGKVYDYYKSVHGRTSLDNRGVALNSLVGVSFYGMPYVNAFWDGTKMVYGNGDAEFRPLSAGLDVVGHEMTHGVVQNTAELVYAGQSGAMNEALADYFGNAIKTDTYGIPMDSPDSGLLGDRLCRTKTPRACAIRDLNDGRTTSKSFLGVAIGTDNGGVHLNSTIFSGALWDIRKDLDRTLADRIVYKALSEYMTPLDGFTEGRAAVLAAAKDLKVSAGEQRAVERAFNAHGIVPGWELAMGVDSDLLFGNVNTDRSRVGAGGGWWASSRSNDEGSEPYTVWAGRLDGSGDKKVLSPNDGYYHANPVTDGKWVIWTSYMRHYVEVQARRITGGPVKKLYGARRGITNVHIEGDTVVIDATTSPARWHSVYLKLSDPSEQHFADEDGRNVFSSQSAISHGRISYVKTIREKNNSRTYGVEILDLNTGKRTVVQAPSPTFLGQTAINGSSVYWLVEGKKPNDPTVIRRANLDGSGVKDISPATGPDALHAFDLSATDDALTATAATPDTAYRNETLAKLWQFTPDGSWRGRVSCNRGEQMSAATPGGKQVVWVDSTTGHTDLVTRTRPAGTCG